MKRILVTGGAGYIGSHAALELTRRGYQVVLFDNLVNGNKDLAGRIGGAALFVGDLLNPKDLERAFKGAAPDAVMHFAAFASVPESVQKPLLYYQQNVEGTLNLLEAMVNHRVNKIIFSSTAAVYGKAGTIPIGESHPCEPINPYGQSKRMVEQILEDLSRAGVVDYIALRYFNAAGADPGGVLGERHRDEHHLIPRILQDILHARRENRQPQVTVYGKDYPTADGTCVRDYIHVTDLASAHILALESLHQSSRTSDAPKVFNLGNEKGFSVLEVASEASKVTGTDLKIIAAPRRPGDPATLVASKERISKELGWQPQFAKLSQIISTAWEWEQRQ